MGSSIFRVAAAQLSSTGDPVENLAAVEEWTQRAADDGAQLVVFPEATMACFGTRLAQVAEDLDGPFASGVRGVARRCGVTVAVGMFTPASQGRVHNTVMVSGPAGEWRYDKVHLYDAFGSRESDYVAPGREVVTAQVGDVTVGVATCYDVRFADQFTALGRAGAQVVVLPASWSDGPGKAEQWDLLTRARAMDAQAYLVACDQAWRPSKGDDALGIGRSVVADPVGGVRARLGHESGLLVTDVDLTLVEQVRRRIPIL
ncbi:Hydrolase [Austwickia sp. TVS 96-490-7B]|uniref:carbon-nitrogen hydrolase family protein n=1 Tax=Austwickia sp. TVS 96-490-7B TaxID=2830843 RepID=UPI001C59D37A|nr:carbon-nitrogen hydrolase family protein [Austwickia sp. TVS 96-490-7B]MBW3085048.1 Hydrolase [Austwickia sp. TVS 96-490-7B]